MGEPLKSSEFLWLVTEVQRDLKLSAHSDAVVGPGGRPEDRNCQKPLGDLK